MLTLFKGNIGLKQNSTWKTTTLGFLLFQFLVLSTTGNAFAQWPQFLGMQRDGVSAEKGLLTKWPARGPKEVFRVSGGVGMSGIAISQSRLVTLIQQDEKQFVVALESHTGKSMWQTKVAPAYKNGMGNGPRGTPTIVGDTLYVFTGQGVLAALDLQTGDIEWRHDTVKELGGKVADYGMAGSPLAVGDYVMVIVGAPGATVAAYERSSGKLAWKSGDDPAGYSSPTLLKLAGKQQVVAFSGNSVLGFNPESGKQLWRYPFVTDFRCNTATPVTKNGHVFISSAESHGSAMLAVKQLGDDFDIEEVWTSFGRNSAMRNEWQTSVLLDGYLYGLDNVGSAGPVTHLNCVEAGTGKRAWQETRFGKGNLIAADGKLFIVMMSGDMVVVKASPKRFEEIGRATGVIGSTRQAPALANGYLYLRDDREIVCLDVREN